MNSITNKTEAYDYLYEVFHTPEQPNKDQLKLAMSFFTEKELQCLNLEHNATINSCFPSIAKKCGCSF